MDPSTPSRHHSNIYLASLRRILVAFAYYSCDHPSPMGLLKTGRRCQYQIGYCQALNYVVGWLLLVIGGGVEFGKMERNNIKKVEEKVFWMLVRYKQINLFAFEILIVILSHTFLSYPCE